jgi:hypothetical protein
MVADWLIGMSCLDQISFAGQYGDVSLCVVPVRICNRDRAICIKGWVSARMLNSENHSDAFFLLDQAKNDIGAARLDYHDPRHGWITLI